MLDFIRRTMITVAWLNRRSSLSLLIILIVASCSPSNTTLLANEINTENLIKFNGTTAGARLYIQLLLPERWEPQTRTGASLSNPFQSTLETIVLEELHGNWNRSQLLLSELNRTHSTHLKVGVYKALWNELRNIEQHYNPHVLINFYSVVNAQSYLETGFKQEIKQALIERCAQILEAPFYGETRSNFPLVANIVQHLSQLSSAVFNEITALLYDAVLLLQSPVTVLQRLDNFIANTEQLAIANLQLAKRKELVNSTAARSLLTRNLGMVFNRPDFSSLPLTLRLEVFNGLPSGLRLLYTAKKICICNVTDDAYIYECPQTYLMCTSGHDPKKAAYSVQRQETDDKVELFAFSNAFWSNRYIRVELNVTGVHDIVKNVYSHAEPNWLQVRFIGELVAIFDDSGTRVLCGGDPIHWDGEEHHVYTRSALQFELYPNECLWQLEDC